MKFQRRGAVRMTNKNPAKHKANASYASSGASHEADMA